MVGWEVSRHPEWDMMYQAGLTAREIADLCRQNVATVHRHLLIRETYLSGFQDTHKAALASRHPDRPTTQWKKQFAEVAKYFRTHGHLPKRSGDAKEFTMYEWIARQRRSYENNLMSPGKIYLLEEIPGWNQSNYSRHLNELWQFHLLELSQFIDNYKTIPRYRNYSSEAERRLGVWLHNQHQKRSRGQLSHWRAEALDQVLPGWVSRG